MYDDLLGEALRERRAAHERLAAVRAGVERLHGEDADARCGLCAEPWPCATRQLVDGLGGGELDDRGAAGLVAAAAAEAAPNAGAVGDGVSHYPVRPAPQVPRMTDVLDRTRTGRALDLLLGGTVGRRR